MKRDGQTVVRTYVRNSDGTYSTKDLLQNSDELEGFRRQIDKLVDAEYLLIGAIATFAGVAAGASVTCYGSIVTGPGAGVVCGGGGIAVLFAAGFVAYAQSRYNNERESTYLNFRSISEPVHRRRCRETATSVSCMG